MCCRKSSRSTRLAAAHTLGLLLCTYCFLLRSSYGDLSIGYSRVDSVGSTLVVSVTPIDAMRLGPQSSGLPLIRDEEVPALVVSFASAIIFLADRTGYWLKEQKQFEPWTFAFLTLLSLAIGLITVTRADKDLGFLNREQTDEWKGWMQSRFISFL